MDYNPSYHTLESCALTTEEMQQIANVKVLNLTIANNIFINIIISHYITDDNWCNIGIINIKTSTKLFSINIYLYLVITYQFISIDKSNRMHNLALALYIIAMSSDVLIHC